jgi:hypothetical protein
MPKLTNGSNKTLGYNIVYIKKRLISKCLYSTLRAKGKATRLTYFVQYDWCEKRTPYFYLLIMSFSIKDKPKGFLYQFCVIKNLTNFFNNLFEPKMNI